MNLRCKLTIDILLNTALEDNPYGSTQLSHKQIESEINKATRAERKNSATSNCLFSYVYVYDTCDPTTAIFFVFFYAFYSIIVLYCTLL